MVAVPSFSLKPSAHAQFTTGFPAHEQLFSPGKKRDLFSHCSGKLLKIRLFGKVGFHLSFRQYSRIPPLASVQIFKDDMHGFPSIFYLHASCLQYV
jgi:hypothetical protein